jgi:hypothetical protein
MPHRTLRAIFENPSRNFATHVSHISPVAEFPLLIATAGLTILAKTAKRNYPEHFCALHFLPQMPTTLLSTARLLNCSTVLRAAGDGRK